MKFDNILSEINGFGKFQIRLFLIQIFARMTLPCHFLLNNFMAAVPSHHCNITALDDGGIFGNLSQPEKLAAGVPTEPDGTLSSCQMFLKPQYHLVGLNSSEDASIVQCQNGWVYDNSTFKSTLVTEWDLVCSRKGMNKATATVFFIGVMVGAPIFGFLSDRFGRRPLLLVSYLSSVLFAILSAFSSSYVMFIIMRFFTGMSLSGISIISIVLNVEWFSIEHRTFAGVIISLDWTLGTWILVGIAYCVNEWRRLIVAVTLPMIVSIITWRYGVAFTYYGISLNITGFGLNTYLTQLIFASIEMPLKIGVYYFLEKVGRRSGEMGSMLSTGLCLLINMFVSQDKWVIRTVVGVIGKAMSEASFTIMYLFTTELFPTVVRQNGLGYTAFVARLGVSISPLIMLLEDVWHLLPAVTYCTVAVVSGLVVSLLPETLNIRLPEYIEDIEKPRGQSTRNKEIQ
ncbi:hypothetical protein ABVT39_003900 [Epinephelus coioides]